MTSKPQIHTSRSSIATQNTVFGPSNDRAGRLKGQGEERNLPEFKELLLKLIEKYDCPFTVAVEKGSHLDIRGAVLPKKQKPKILTPISPSSLTSMSTSKVNNAHNASGTNNDSSAPAVPVNYINDALGRLVEINIDNARHVPRNLVQIIGLLLPQYPQFRKISMRHCKIDCYTIHELNKMLHKSTLSEICLDGSPVPEGNYFSLLELTSNLTNLSLCRCNIDDRICELIASKLQNGSPATRNLLLLNLTSNHVTDVGVKHLGTALRSNRSLRYLNLSGNSISDDGVRHIFDALKQFPLRIDEISRKRKHFINEAWQKHSNYPDATGLNPEDETGLNSGGKNAQTPPPRNRKAIIATGSGPRKSQAADKAIEEMKRENLHDPYKDSFGKSCLILDHGLAYSPGNMILCYLNLAYNNLGYLSLKYLLSVLRYQSLNKTQNQIGLVKVVLEGNYVPPACEELKLINDLLQPPNRIGRRSTNTPRTAKAF